MYSIIVSEESPETKSSCGCDKILTKSVGSCDGQILQPNQTKPNQTLFLVNWGNERFTGTLQTCEWRDNEI